MTCSTPFTLVTTLNKGPHSAVVISPSVHSPHSLPSHANNTSHTTTDASALSQSSATLGCHSHHQTVGVNVSPNSHAKIRFPFGRCLAGTFGRASNLQDHLIDNGALLERQQRAKDTGCSTGVAGLEKERASETDWVLLPWFCSDASRLSALDSAVVIVVSCMRTTSLYGRVRTPRQAASQCAISADALSRFALTCDFESPCTFSYLCASGAC